MMHTNFRERITGIPLLMKNPDPKPPVKFPKSAARKGIQAKIPICFRLKPRASLRY
jgi:hypothetical protein